MTFTPTPELTREMIQYGKALTHLTHQEYQSMMIEKFYPDADTEVIDQMVEWSKYPTLNLITLKELKDIEIELAQESTDHQTLYCFNSNKINIENATSFGIAAGCSHDQTRVFSGTRHSWKSMTTVIINTEYTHRAVFGGLSEPKVNSYYVATYTAFVNIMQSIWSAHKLTQDTLKLQVEVDLLKQQNAELRYQLQLNTYNLELLMRLNPVYNYDEIKSRKQKLHSEFKRVAKLMKLG